MASSKQLIQAAAGVSTGPEGAWDLSYAYYDPPESTLWNISGASFLRSYYFYTQTQNVQGVFFKPDGTKMYTICRSLDNVNEYDLSTAWDVSSSSFSQSFSISAQDGNVSGLFFKSDGTKMYLCGYNTDSIYEYNLSTAWDISAASYNQSFSVSSQETEPHGIFFKTDGSKMYLIGASSDAVNEYDLSTSWDISTATYSQNFSVSSEDSDPKGLFFKSDGTKMYIVGDQTNTLYQYDLSTAWDVSTASYKEEYGITTTEQSPTGMYIKPDGSKMYVVGTQGDDVGEYVLGGFDVSVQTGTDSTGFFFKDDGSKMYVLGATGSPADAVHEYDLSTSWDIGTASFLQSFSVASQETVPTNLFFKSDGTKMYVIGAIGDDVNEYNLSTAWDVSTSTYSQNFSFAAQETNPRGIYFKDDGTKMYISGVGSDAVNEYNLSTAWDVTTASYSQNFSVNTQETNNRGLFFKPDGSKMYISGTTGDAVYEYDLSTSWDVSSASYVQNFSVADQETTPQAVFFKSDGTQMFVTGQATEAVYTYSLGVQE